MRIFVIDDDKEELEKAEEIIKARGHKVSISHIRKGMEAYMLGNMLWRMPADDGIITDLNFEMPGGYSGITPSGLLIALHAIALGKPVVICTRFKEGDNHHGARTSWIYDGYFRALDYISRCEKKPDMFLRWPDWVEKKNWELACKRLENKFVALGGQ